MKEIIEDLNPDIKFIKGFLKSHITSVYFKSLLEEVVWQKNLKASNGEVVSINRMMCYVSDNPTKYSYANLELDGYGWSAALSEIKEMINTHTGYGFNSVLLNLYEDGRDEIRWHSDKESQLGENPVIASFNLGASRTFHMRNKETGEKKEYLLEDGDLLIMLENCQKNWLHAILKEKHIKEPRISLTFRKVII